MADAEEMETSAVTSTEQEESETSAVTSTEQVETSAVTSTEQVPSTTEINMATDDSSGEQSKTPDAENSQVQDAENSQVQDAENSQVQDAENSQVQENGTGEKDETAQPDMTEQHDYELVDGQYFYTDSTSGVRYMYDTAKGEWVVVETSEADKGAENHGVTTDKEGRTFYYADNMHLCRDKDDNVFFWEDDKWKPWAEKANDKKSSRWYFYQGDNTFYRDITSNVIYKMNKETNAWEVHEEKKLKKKRPRIDEEEEFDTESEDSEEEEGDGSAPPGVRNDPNIDYDGETYTKKDPSDGMVYEWDCNRRAWFPKLDEDFMATYQLSYGFNPDGTKNENPLKFDDDEEEREAEAERIREEEEKKKEDEKKEKKKPSWFKVDDSQNTKVYVSNLPETMTEDEFVELMGKCGMVLKDVQTNKFKIKMYKDAEGNFKGDALCTYIKIESINLAIQILDDYQVENKRIRVERATFQQKGEYNPKLKPQKKKKKELEKFQRQQEKLFDWRPEPMRGQRQKNENTVIIRNVFDPKEFETKMEKILTHKEAMRNQCDNFGQVRKLDLFDLHPEGVVKVIFQEVEAADMCIATLNKRLYEGRTLSVAVWDGKEKYWVEETAAEREERLKKWDKFVEGENTET